MNIEYDKIADALYIRLSEEKVAKTVEIQDSLVADLDGEGNIVGIEMLDVSSVIAREQAVGTKAI